MKDFTPPFVCEWPKLKPVVRKFEFVNRHRDAKKNHHPTLTPALEFCQPLAADDLAAFVLTQSPTSLISVLRVYDPRSDQTSFWHG